MPLDERLATSVADGGENGATPTAIPISDSLRQVLLPCSHYPHIRIVRAFSELRQIGRLRHNLFVEEQGKKYKSCVLERNCLLEPSDFTGVNMYTVQDGRLTAAMRANDLLDRTLPAAETFIEVARDAGLPASQTMTCTRVVRAPEHIGTHAGDIVRYVRFVSTQRGYRYCVAQSAERLLPYWKRFGFVPTGRVVKDPTAGVLYYLILDTKFRPTLRG